VEASISPWPKKVQQVKNSVKSVLSCFFDIDGINHKEFVLQDQIINATFYCDILRWLKEDMKWKWLNRWCTNSWVLHHDGVPTHTALAVQQVLASRNMTVVLHCPYLPDLALCDFFFPKIKIKLKGRRFYAIEQIQAKLQEVL
jgi:hypothetical protein